MAKNYKCMPIASNIHCYWCELHFTRYYIISIINTFVLYWARMQFLHTICGTAATNTQVKRILYTSSVDQQSELFCSIASKTSSYIQGMLCSCKFQKSHLIRFNRKSKNSKVTVKRARKNISQPFRLTAHIVDWMHFSMHHKDWLCMLFAFSQSQSGIFWFFFTLFCCCAKNV